MTYYSDTKMRLISHFDNGFPNFVAVPITVGLNRYGGRTRRDLTLYVQARDRASYDDTVDQVRGALWCDLGWALSYVGLIFALGPGLGLYGVGLAQLLACAVQLSLAIALSKLPGAPGDVARVSWKLLLAGGTAFLVRERVELTDEFAQGFGPGGALQRAEVHLAQISSDTLGRDPPALGDPVARQGEHPNQTEHQQGVPQGPMTRMEHGRNLVRRPRQGKGECGLQQVGRQLREFGNVTPLVSVEGNEIGGVSDRMSGRTAR